MMEDSKKEKILIIEANIALGHQISASLIKQGYKVTLVKDGREGLKNIYDILPHLIIIDINMPGADSYDIIAKKHAENLLKKIPVFLLSIEGLPIDMGRLPQESVTEFITTMKADMSEIIEKVNHLFSDKSPVQDEKFAKTNQNKKKLVWVEDDKLIGSILAKKLVASNFDLMHLTNGEEALEELKKIVPDAIILDILLPGMSGLEILQKIRDDHRLDKVPVMILSNLSKPSDIEKAKILDAKKFLVKASTSLDQIVANINEMCA